MITFDGFIMQEGSPIYLQILLYIKKGIVAGTIKDGDELPSRRVLSALLGVNPNTVQKAYRQLEEDGLILSRAGTKSYVAVTGEMLQSVRQELLDEDARGLVRSFKLMGITKEETHLLVEKYWEVEEVGE